MGYRSEVAIVMHNTDYKTMLKRAKSLKDKSILELINDADKYSAEDSKVIILYWDSIKWYNEFKEIQWIEKFIKSKEVQFVRIGEDFEDCVEECYNNAYDLTEYAYVNRNIEMYYGRQITNKTREEII